MGSGIHGGFSGGGSGNLGCWRADPAGLKEASQGGAAGTTGLSWAGAQTAAPAQTRGTGKAVMKAEAGRRLPQPWNWTAPTPVEGLPHVSLLSFHYIQIRSAINFIKSKQSWSENGASRQSCGGMGRRNPGEQGRVVVAAVKGQEVEGWGRGLPCRILPLQGSHHFYGRLHPSEVMPAWPSLQTEFQILRAGMNCGDHGVCY